MHFVGLAISEFVKVAENTERAGTAEELLIGYVPFATKIGKTTILRIILTSSIIYKVLNYHKGHKSRYVSQLSI